MYRPTKIFFTKGVGRSKEYLTSFELSLRSARIEMCNLVSVSSIFPVNCRRVTIEEGLKEIEPGQIVHAVIARNSTNEPNRLVAASLGVALPTDKNAYGYLSEHHPYGQTEKIAGEYAEDLAATMLATTLGIEFDVNAAWSEREQTYKASGKIIKTKNTCQSAEGDKNGLWTTTIAVAVFI